MVSEKSVTRIAQLAASLALLVPAFAGAQSTPLLNEVHTIASSTVAVPVEHTFTSSSAGQYTVALTDLGAGLTPPAPLTAATMAVTQGDTVVGTPVTLQQGAPTVTLTFTATANTSYTLHIVGTPATGLTSSPIAENIAAPDNSSVGSYVDSIALPSPQVANGESILYDAFTVTAQDNYTITLTDLKLPAALKTLILAVIPTGGTPAATLPVPGSPNPMTTTVPLNPGSYQIVAIGKTDPTVPTDVGGLFTASVVGSQGSVPYPAKIVTVGAVTQLQSAALAAGPYSLTLTDLKFPAALSGGNAVLGAAVIRDDGLPMATLNAAGNQAFTVATSGNQYYAYAVANPGSSTAQGSYALQVQSTAPSPPPPAISSAQIVSASTTTSVYSFNTTIASAGSYTVTLTDFAFPGALTGINLAAVQGAALLGTPLSQAGNFSINAAQGPLTLLAYGTAANSGGVFGIDVSPATGTGSAVFDVAQPVGLAFVTHPLTISSSGSYLVTAADVGFPASFSSFDVLVTHGTQSVGQIFGGGKFTFNATSGTYFVDFVALPSGTAKAGTYSLSVAPTPPAPTVTLTASPTTVDSGGTVTLTWSSQNATTCVASNGWSGTQATSGTATSAALTGATTFTLTCSGDGGSTAQSASVTVNSPASSSSGHSGGGAITWLTVWGLLGALLVRAARGSGISTRVAGKGKALIAASFAILLPLAAPAAEVENSEPAPMAQIRATMKERYPEAKVEAISASKVMPGWYELVVGDQIVYADASADRLIVGKIVDTRTRQDLTAKSWSEAHKIDFKALPFDHSIKTVHGKGERVMAIFEDPLCPYCQKLEEQIKDLQDVTIYTFLLPLESIHPGATVKAREIWCSKDPSTAWSDWMIKHTEPKESKTGDCQDPTGLTLETAAKFNLNSTPTLVFPDGDRVVGTLTPELLEKELQQSRVN